MLQYLSAYFGPDTPPALLEEVAASLPDDEAALETLRQRLERSYAQPAAEGAQVKATIDEALRIGTLLRQNTQEMDGRTRCCHT